MHTLLGEAEGTTFPADYAAGVDPDDASAALQADWGKTVLRWVPPDQVENLRQVGGLPRVLAGVVAILAVSTLVHTLVTSVRHRRSDLAVLKALGFSRRQVWATVAWQATTLAALALLAGLPLGLAGGRWAWRLVAESIGTPAGAVTPIVAVLVTVPAVLATANLLAVLPARAAARVRPAVVLRSE
ncbi:MAG TPA: FtsX-like permease family protein [Acidimicrobiales bacterium]|nr:FtsX-like permease family protein [Acidimicrobiales bacterium]